MNNVTGKKELRIVQQVFANDKGEFRLLGLRPGTLYLRISGARKVSIRSFNSTAKKGNHWEYTVKSVTAPTETARMPKPPDLDQHRIQSILDRGLPSAGILEVDHFHGAGMIGANHERKACFRIALAIDSKTGFAFPPEVGAPEASTGDLLQRVILRAIAPKHALPLEIHVSNHDFKILLEPLAQALGCQVKLRKSLQTLEFAKSEMQSMFGDPGFAH